MVIVYYYIAHQIEFHSVFKINGRIIVYSAKLAIPLAKSDDFIQFSRNPDAYLQEF